MSIKLLCIFLQLLYLLSQISKIPRKAIESIGREVYLQRS